MSLALRAVRALQAAAIYLLGPLPPLPAATLTVIDAESFAVFGSTTVPVTMAVLVTVVFPFTSTVTGSRRLRSPDSVCRRGATSPCWSRPSAGP